MLDLLSNLVDKSLVEADPHLAQTTSRARYRLLETVREYGQAKPRTPGIRARHRDFFLGLAEGAVPHLMGSEQHSWLARLSADHENIRLALAACTDGDPEDALQADHERGLRFVTALLHYWLIRGSWREEGRILDLLLERTVPDAPSGVRAHAVLQAGDLALYRGELDLARRRCEEALAIGRQLGDMSVIVRAVHNTGGVALHAGQYDDARARFRESLDLARQSGQTVRVALAFNSLGVVDDRQGRLDEASRNYEESLAVYRQLADRYHEAILLNNLGGIALQRQDYPAAQARLEGSLAIHRELEDRWGLAHSLHHLGSLSMVLGDPRRARERYRESLRYYHELNDRTNTIKSIASVGLSLVEDDAPSGLRLLEATESLRAALGLPISENNAREIEDARRAFRAALGESGFAAAVADGKSLTLDEATRRALG